MQTASTNAAAILEDKIKTHTARVGIIGLGYVGLPLAMEFAKAGFYLTDTELPDYLPLVLEFASIAESKYVQRVLAIHGKAIVTLYEALKKEEKIHFA